ncbi:MAG: lysine--tRNA ligase [Candidatus Anammoxibacter sp.]
MNKFEQDRLEKLKKLKENGIDPYGSTYKNTQSLGSVVDEYSDDKEESVVRVAGRIMTMRPHGKAAFLDIADWTGRIQIYIKKDKVGDAQYDTFKLLDLGDIIGIDGKLFKTRTGEVTVYTDELTILSKAILPPPEKWHGLKDVELRYRQRYVDLFSNPDVMKSFLNRTKIIKWIREHLDRKDFVEVETPMMQPIPGGATAKPFITKHNTYDMELYMRIAPELYLKRLLVGGMERIYEMNRNFRNEGVSTRHNPEFTMIEIYQAYSDYVGMMELTEAMISDIAKNLYGKYEIPYGDLVLDLTPPWQRKKYSDLLKEFGHVDIGNKDEIIKKAKELHIATDGKDIDTIANDIFELVVEPELNMPTFVIDYPKSLCPLTKACDDNPYFAQRFELYMAGMEIANAYTELNEPLEQAERFREQAGDSETGGKIDEDFLLSLKYGMPPAGGLGIGVDRVVMLLTNTTSIRDVILFPLLRAESHK